MHLAVWCATEALGRLADLVVGGARIQDVGARARSHVAARGAVTARRAGTGVQRSFAQATGEPFQTAAEKYVLDVRLAGDAPGE